MGFLVSRNVRVSAAILAGLLLSACAHQSGPERSAAIRGEAEQMGWQSQIIRTPQYDLQSFGNKKTAVDGMLTVYIEGDGHAWVDGQFAAADPTPYQPIALRLAMAQPGQGAIAYLGRPCQYLGAQADTRCNKQVWTDARFSNAAVTATSDALDQLMAQRKATRLQLVGYSGGAAIALLVAARRQDVARIITVAGNLDPQAWAAQLNLQGLQGSLDTRRSIAVTSAIPQIDFVGGKDRVVPLAVTEAFVQQYPSAHRPRIIVKPDNGHTCCWVEQWPELWIQAQVNSL